MTSPTGPSADRDGGTRLWLLRHGRAAATWAEADDPGLDGQGRAQAAAAADELAGRVRGLAAPVRLCTSPMRRTVETAAPLAVALGVAAELEPAIGEVPTPPGVEDRAAWLDELLGSDWSSTTPALRAWRQALVAWAGKRREDTVAVTHFVAINALVGASTGDDRALCRMVGTGAVVELAVAFDGTLTLIDAPESSPGRVL